MPAGRPACLTRWLLCLAPALQLPSASPTPCALARVSHRPQDVRQGACLQHLKLETPLLSCTLLPDGSGGQCLAAAGADGGVHFVDVTSGAGQALSVSLHSLVWLLNLPGPLHCLWARTWSPQRAGRGA